MARPKSAAARTEKVQFRATFEELVTLRLAAERHGMSLGDYAREASNVAARGALGKKPRKPRRPARQPSVTAIEPQRLDAAAYQQIRMLGVNLNQIAHQLNALMLPVPPDLAPLLAEIRRILDQHVGARPRP